MIFNFKLSKILLLSIRKELRFHPEIANTTQATNTKHHALACHFNPPNCHKMPFRMKRVRK